MNLFFPFLLSIILPPLSCLSAGLRVGLAGDTNSPQAQFAAAEIRQALAETGHEIATREPAAVISLQLDTKTLSSQGYRVRSSSGRIDVHGGDANGLLYGGLEVAERIRLEADPRRVGDADGRPHLEKRGLKFNIPLDLRTPSYSDCSDASQQNIPEMWSLDFWHEFLDEMARHRFNVLSLWSLHPFPSIVKVPEFPKVALDDVWRTRVKLEDNFSHSGSDMLKPAMLKDVEVVRKMTIDDKIQFWREVMRHARDRGIEVYWFTWNIFTFGAEPKYGINPAPTNPVTIAYFRASVRETVLNYPLLAGFGITAGENMPKGNYSKEQWLWQTYGLGIMDAKKLQPNRQLRLIHRYHMTGQDEILREWKAYPDTFDFSFKYAIAHMYSVTNPPFIQSALPHLGSDRRTWLTVRNDDIYSFRWGDPQFARGFIMGMPGADKMAGFYMGPDGYCWGRSFMDREPGPAPLVIRKQWYSFMLWGRLSYDPSLPDTLFERTLARRFPQVPADRLAATWAEASRIFPQITRFFWGDIDLRWLPEACLSSPRHEGFYTVRHFMQGETMPGAGILNIRQWRKAVLEDKPIEGLTPLQVADALDHHADAALAGVEAFRPSQGNDAELRLTLGDCEAFARLGQYYAAKIRGACELALFDGNSRALHRRKALGHLQDALDHWKEYAAVYARQYKQPLLYNRVGWVDIPALTKRAEEDVATARDWQPGTLPTDGPRRGSDTPFRQ
jgi:hypothetical protein